MTIVAVFIITIMCIYSVTNTVYGYDINSKEKNYVQNIYKT